MLSATSASATADLGETTTAIDYLQQALDIARDISDRSDEAAAHATLGAVYLDRQEWQLAAQLTQRAVAIADAIGNSQVQSAARLMLATIQLLVDDVDAARDTAQAAVGTTTPRPGHRRSCCWVSLNSVRQPHRRPSGRYYRGGDRRRTTPATPRTVRSWTPRPWPSVRSL
jgi:tetratricopeptide (TPR) repeat protein